MCTNCGLPTGAGVLNAAVDTACPGDRLRAAVPGQRRKGTAGSGREQPAGAYQRTPFTAEISLPAAPELQEFDLLLTEQGQAFRGKRRFPSPSAKSPKKRRGAFPLKSA